MSVRLSFLVLGQTELSLYVRNPPRQTIGGLFDRPPSSIPPSPQFIFLSSNRQPPELGVPPHLSRMIPGGHHPTCLIIFSTPDQRVLRTAHPVCFLPAVKPPAFCKSSLSSSKYGELHFFCLSRSSFPPHTSLATRFPTYPPLIPCHGTPPVNLSPPLLVSPLRGLRTWTKAGSPGPQAASSFSFSLFHISFC